MAIISKLQMQLCEKKMSRSKGAERSTAFKGFDHVLDRVYFSIKGYIYTHILKAHGVDSQLSNEEPFHEKQGLMFFFSK